MNHRQSGQNHGQFDQPGGTAGLELPPDLAGSPTQTRVLGAGPTWGCVILGLREHGPTPQTEGWHRSRLFAINILLQGRGQFTDSATRRHHDLIPGAVYHHVPGSRAKLTLDGSSRCIEAYLLFDHQTRRGLETLQLLPKHELLFTNAPRLALDQFASLYRSCRQPHNEVSRRGVLLHLAAFLTSLYDRATLTRGNDFWENTVRQAARRLDENLADAIHLPDLARELHVAYPSLRRAFSRLMGVSPGEYRIRRRIEAACQLLAQHPVKETAARLGYCDPFTFSSQFRRYTGSSPTAFQRNVQPRGA